MMQHFWLSWRGLLTAWLAIIVLLALAMIDDHIQRSEIKRAQESLRQTR
jgi:hypothetical protein